MELELRSVANDTLREATLVPTITVEEQTHQKSTIVPPPRPSSNKLQGDWAARDRSIFTPPSQQQLPMSKPRSRRGSNASEPDGDIFTQHTWANRVEKTPEKFPLQPQSLAAAMERTQREPSPYRGTQTSEKTGHKTPPIPDSKSNINRRHSYEPFNTRRSHPADYKRVASSPNMLMQQSTGRPRSQGYEYSSNSRGGSYKRGARPYRGHQQNLQRSAGRDFASQMSSTQLYQPPGDQKPWQLGGVAFNRSQSDSRGMQPTIKEHSSHSSAKSEPLSHSTGASGEWTEVRRKSTKPKQHPPSTQGKSNPKDRRYRR